MLKKYLAIYKYMFIRTLEFRSEIFIYSLLDILPFIVLFFIWQAIYLGKESINNYSFPEIVQYYLLVMIIERCSATHFEGWRAREIREGKIDYFLTRPFSYLNEVFSKDAGGKIVSLAISLPVFFIFYLVLQNGFDFSPLDISLYSAILFLIFMVVAYLIQFMIAFWIVVLTFWFEGSQGLEHFKWIIITLFSGAMIPYEFMPSWLQTMFNWLPLKYIYAFPIAIIQNRIELSFTTISTIIATLTGMFLVTIFLWEKAKYRYSSAGG
jgi:ABC-2 type transport system permease protein